MPESLLLRIRELAERVAASEGIEVVDVEFRGKSLLRIFIDKPGGITHHDCEVVSKQVGAILDVEDFIPSRYTLEVSSPGWERRLHRAADYERFAGKKVRLILKEPAVTGSRQVVGKLEGLREGLVHVTTERETVSVPLDNVERANLVFEW